MSEAAAEKSGGGLAPLRAATLSGALAMEVGGSIALGAGPLLYRMGMLDLSTASEGVEGWAMMAFIAAGVLALLALVMSVTARKHRGAILAVLLLIAAGTGAGTLYGQSLLRAALPPLFDVQTDWSQPVAFSESTLRAREAAGAARIRDDAVVPEGEGKWSGKTFAEAQKAAPQYEDIEPLIVSAAPPDATVAAEKIAKQLGWSVMLSDPPNGQLEAVNYTFWYGLASDIAVRIQPSGQGSRVDVRSASRIGQGDGGANAGRVKEFLNELAFALR